MADNNTSQDQLSSSGGTAQRRLRIGTRLLQDAFSADGVLLLRAGSSIQTPRELERLSHPLVRFGPDGSHEIPFDLDNEAALDGQSAPTDPRAADFERSVGKAAVLKSQAVEDIRSVFDRIGEGGETDLSTARSVVSSLLTSMLDDPRALTSMSLLKDADAYTYTHSVNVSILAMHLAMHTQYRDDLEDIGVGALMHDVGKMKIPLSVLNKQGALAPDEWAIMKQHPQIGYDQLKRAGESRDIVLSCVLSHHEKVDGTGYPRAKRGHHLSPPAMITAVADVYDALTTTRPYRPAMDSLEAIQLMTTKMAPGLESNLLQCFVSVVGCFPVGSEVRLSDGRVGTVLSHYATSPKKPCVIVHTDTQGNATSPVVVDLSKEHGLSVKGFVEERRIQDIARDALAGRQAAA